MKGGDEAKENLGSLLYQAAEKGDLEAVKKLIAEGSEVDIPDSKGRTPLFAASTRGHAAVVGCLLDFGADPLRTDRKGRGYTYLHKLARGSGRIAQLLIDKGADVNALTEKNSTALHRAAKHGDLKVCRVLVENGVNLNVTTRKGRTALSNAAVRGRINVLKYLIEKGAKLGISEDRDDTYTVWFGDQKTFRNTTTVFDCLLEIGDLPNQNVLEKLKKEIINRKGRFCDNLMNTLDEICTQIKKCYKVPVMPLLFLAREKSPESFFHKDFLPLDIFKLIYKFVRQAWREYEADRFDSRNFKNFAENERRENGILW